MIEGNLCRIPAPNFTPERVQCRPPDAPEMFDTVLAMKLRLEKVLRLTNPLGWRSWLIRRLHTSHITASQNSQYPNRRKVPSAAELCLRGPNLLKNASRQDLTTFTSMRENNHVTPWTARMALAAKCHVQ
jgi:hypothetical protein